MIFEEYPYHAVHIIKNEWGVCESVQFSKKGHFNVSEKSEMYHRRSCALYSKCSEAIHQLCAKVRHKISEAHCLLSIVYDI